MANIPVALCGRVARMKKGRQQQRMIDQRVFRDALGTFATGVCVVTAVPDEGAPIGMTINSFSSVSLEPPLVLWSIQNDSECFDAFNGIDRFAISVLSGDQEAYSNLYATKGDHALSDGHYHMAGKGTAVISDALAAFECRVWARYPGGDHTIIVGEVLAVNPGQGAGAPLLFHQGRYARIG